MITTNIKNTLFNIILFLFVSGAALAQSNCKNYHINQCGGFGPPFKYSGQSKSAMFEVGESSKLKLSAFGGFEYSVSLCADKQLKGVFFRIVEEAANSVLFDSQTEGNGINDKQFYVEDSKTLIIEVVVPDIDKPKDEVDYEKLVGCVGVVIEYRKVGKRGFD